MEGEPARAAVADAIASTCRRLGCRGIHPLEWRPTHLCNKENDGGELRDDLLIESYLAGMVRCNWRGKLTAGGRARTGPLDTEHWGLTRSEKFQAGPRVWEEQLDVWDTEGRRCVFSRRLAAAGIATWSDITDSTTGEWLTTAQASAISGLEGGADRAEYVRLTTELENDTTKLGVGSATRAVEGGCERRKSRRARPTRTK